MNPSCRQFRDRLAGALGGPQSAPPEALRALSWHEHLLGCADCRAVLEAEEALEDLLASLPEPRLPAGVAARVLERLALDRLLEAAGGAPAPSGLAARVLAGLEAERSEAALDRLLERVPAPVAPRDLAARTLAALEGERLAMQRPVAPLRRRAPAPLALGLRLAAALALLVGGALGVRALLSEDRTPAEEVAVVDPPETPPAELLESLDLLEAWELITDDSIDVVLTSLDTADEVLLEIDQGEDPLEPVTEEPSKG